MITYAKNYYEFMKDKTVNLNRRFVEIFTKNVNFCGHEDNISITPLELVERGLKELGCKCTGTLNGNRVSSITKCKTEMEWKAYQQPTKIKVTLYKDNKVVNVAYYVCSEHITFNKNSIIKDVTNFASDYYTILLNNKYFGNDVQDCVFGQISWNNTPNDVKNIIIRFSKLILQYSYSPLSFCSFVRVAQESLEGHKAWFVLTQGLFDGFIGTYDANIDKASKIFFNYLTKFDEIARNYAVISEDLILLYS